MKNIYNFFSKKHGDKRVYPDYKSLFHEKYSLDLAHPILFLFDNELQSGERPLYKFINHIGIRGKEKQAQLKTDLFTPIAEKLYLITNPLIGNKEECEIEDLFSKETLEHALSGKTFSRQKGYDINKHFGKEIFSKYIASNYKTIDFSNFKLIFDAITKIVNEKSV